MILTCPSCATGYFVPDDAIGADGRKVRCKACGNVWKAERVDEPLELTVAPDEAPRPAPETSDVHHLAGLPPEALAEAPAEELPKAFRARAEQNRRLKRAAAHGVVWAGLASVFAAILAGAWLFRVEVVEVWPRAAAAYAAVGSPVNVVGLQFEAVGARPLVNDPGSVVVSGALRNIRDREVSSPPIRIALLDAHGAEIAHRILDVRKAPVLPGKVQGFAIVIPDPTARGVGVDVQFVKAGEHHAPSPAAHGEDHGGGHSDDQAAPAGHDAQPGHGAQPSHGAPAHGPTAADSGLRPSISADVSAPVAAVPVAAVPVEAHPPAAAPAASHGAAHH
jgi:predicted Zn finger-like uncharacterized protein